jgi:hypothetical protein
VSRGRTSLVRHLLLVGLCVWAIYIQFAYRVPSRILPLILPWISVGLTCLSLAFLINPLLRRASADDPIRQGFARAERVGTILIVGFILHSLFLFANGKLGPAEDTTHASEVLRIGGGQLNLGPMDFYTWVDLRSWRREGAVERVLLAPLERWRMWGGQEVLAHVRPGLLRVPWLGRIERDDGRYLRSVLKMTPTASQPWKDLVAFYVRNARFDEAIASAHEYLKVYPDDVDFALRVTADLYNSYRHADAVPLLEPFLTRAPGAQVYRNLGFALTRAGRKAEGVDLLKKAISLEPDEWWTYYALGYAYFYDGEFREAAPWFEKVLELRPHFPEIEDRLRQIRAGQGPRSKPKP